MKEIAGPDITGVDADGGKRKGGQGRSESMQNTESRETRVAFYRQTD